MALMQNACQHQLQSLKSRMQQYIIKLHAILTKFHIWRDQNGATIQQLQSTQGIMTICPKQRDAYLGATKHDATGVKWAKNWYKIRL